MKLSEINSQAMAWYFGEEGGVTCTIQSTTGFYFMLGNGSHEQLTSEEITAIQQDFNDLGSLFNTAGWECLQ